MKDDLKAIIEKFKKHKVLVLGDAILDTYIKGTSERLCREAPVPVINVCEQEHACGGAANTAINVAALGAETYFLSIIGKDDNGKELVSALNKNKVNTDFIVRDKDRSTLTKKRITASSNILLRVDEGSTHKISHEVEKTLLDKIKKLYRKVDTIILSDYGYGVITEAVIELLAAKKTSERKYIIVDSKNLHRFKILAPTAAKPNYEETLKLLHLPRLEETDRVAQVLENAAPLLEITGAKYVAATLDIDGTILFEKGRTPHRIHTAPQDNKRAIGAGDTFISAFALSLCSGASGTASAEIASSAAAIVLQKDGTVVCNCNDLRSYFTENPKFVSNIRELTEKMIALRREGKKIVFANGCFDILHRGHINLLNQAKALGDVLIVGINSDESIKKLKGNERPINSLEDRITVLAGLQAVTLLVSFNSDTPAELIKAVKPDFFVKGGDYTKDSIPEAALVKQMGGEVKIIPFLEKRSTTLIIEKIKAPAKKGNSENLDKFQYAKASGME